MSVCRFAADMLEGDTIVWAGGWRGRPVPGEVAGSRRIPLLPADAA